MAAMGGVLGAQHLGGPLAQLANAQSASTFGRTQDRYYIFCYFSGGWDILVGLDPRDPRNYTSLNRRITLIQPGYEFLDGVGRDIITHSNGMQFGPHIGDLQNHSNRLAVIRGMSMDTLTHEVGRRRFITGMPPSGLQARGSSINTWLAARLGQEEPIPNLSIRVESYNQNLPTYASALSVGGTADLLRTLTPTDPTLSLLIDRQIDQSLTDASQCSNQQASSFLQAAEESRQKSREMLEGGFGQRFEFNRPEHAALRDHYGIRNMNDSPEIRAALAVEAICSSMTRCVNVQVASGLDTHFDNWESDQGAIQERGFNTVARMVEDLANRQYKDTSRSWLDHTVIVGFSEFSRTPLLNSNGGRDHALTNASFLIGGGIQGGQVIGQSSNVGMQPMAVNLQTGQAVSNPAAGEVIRPEHILQTLLHEVGIGEEADLRVPHIPALLS
jgi:uncharacterized protein (DUF1501 family)